MVLLLVDWVVVVIPLIRWYCGESHTTSLLPVLVVVHLVDFGGDYDRDGLCYVILNSDDFTFNKYFIIFTQLISEDGPLSTDVLF